MVGGVRFDFMNVDAADYAHLRPSYAQDAIDWVVARTGIGRGTTVVDVGAGTGQLSKEFARRGASVWAVEPAANMRAELASSSPGVRVLDGYAESLPVPEGLAELVVVGQAMHYFEPQAALAEIHRVPCRTALWRSCGPCTRQETQLSTGSMRSWTATRRTVIQSVTQW
jgi:ubiquinone/menaquinone biosynthesis C-methylase UbiE